LIKKEFEELEKKNEKKDTEKERETELYKWLNVFFG
jgi:hypothetical protein